MLSKKVYLITGNMSLKLGGVPQVVSSLNKNLNVDSVIVSPVFDDDFMGRKIHSVHDFYLDAKKNRGIIFIHGLWDLFSLRCYLIALFLRLPIMISPHGMLEDWAFNHKKVKKRFAWFTYQKVMMKFANAIVVNSDKEKNTVKKRVSNKFIEVIPNAVDLESNNLPSFKDRSKRVLFLSRVSKVKGVPDLIEAWSKVHSKKNYKLSIAGPIDDDMKDVLEELLAYYNVKESVEILGPVYGTSKWNLYKDSHLFVLPSYSENFGIVIAESLSCGTPVITTESTPWLNLCVDEIGFTVPNNSHKLYLAIEEFINLPYERKLHMSEKAFSYSSVRFNWREVASRYNALFERLL